MSTTPFGRAYRREWGFEDGLTYLNHGTVGATPRVVREVERAIREEMDRQPSRFVLRDLGAHTSLTRTRPRARLRDAADRVARFLGANGDDLVFVDNVTTGANAVVQSFPLEPGDEILVSDLGYGGVTNAAIHGARRAGATVKTVAMPHPIVSDAPIVDAFEHAVGPRTRLAIVDHIAAQTALILPVAAIAARLKARGVAVLVDGAHAPGSIPLAIVSVGADYYVGNLHKWLWTPMGSGILWAAPERQAGLQSPIASWGLDAGFHESFDTPGTRDAAAHLAAPAAIDFMERLGVAAVQAWNHGLAWRGAQFLADAWGTTFDPPEAMVPTMATIRLPEALGSTAAEALALRDRLLFEHRIEVPVHAARGRLWTRISAQIYNDMEDIEQLGAVVTAIAQATLPV
jgi:isopenicillin-N epimerase